MAKPTFGAWLHEARPTGLGLRRAAALIGISPTYLSRLEADELPRPPSGDVLHRIAHAYGKDIKEVMDHAPKRVDEVIAADPKVATAIHAFYRLAHDQPIEMQEKMLRAALGELDLEEEDHRALWERLRAILSQGGDQNLPRLASGDDGLFAFHLHPRYLSARQIQRAAESLIAAQMKHEYFDHGFAVPVEDIAENAHPTIRLAVRNDLGGRLRHGSPVVLGLARWSNTAEYRELVVHEDLFGATEPAARGRCKFTLGHELFHCIEHLPLMEKRYPQHILHRVVASVTVSPEFSSTCWYARKRAKRKLATPEQWREWQANHFSASLLMPERRVRHAFTILTGEEVISVDDQQEANEVADALARATGQVDGRIASLSDLFEVNPAAMAIRLRNLGLVVEKEERDAKPQRRSGRTVDAAPTAGPTC